MKKYLLTITAAVYVLFLACNQVEKPGEDAASKQEIMTLLQNQVNAWNQGDIDGFMAGYWRSDSLRFASGGDVTFGWETTLQRYKKAYPDKATMGILSFEIHDITFFPRMPRLRSVNGNCSEARINLRVCLLSSFEKWKRVGLLFTIIHLPQKVKLHFHIR